MESIKSGLSRMPWVKLGLAARESMMSGLSAMAWNEVQLESCQFVVIFLD